MLEDLSSEFGMDVGAVKRLKEMINVLRKREVLQGVSPIKVRQILEDLGPTFTKLGQIISMRPDLLPQEYQMELMKLQSSVTPLPFEVIKDMIEGEYKCSWNDVFFSIDENPLGAASIAQVHRAYLITGERVVIKVQRPGIYELMERDIVLLKRAVRILNIVSDASSVVDINDIISEMWEAAKQEMDFMREADHIEEFKRTMSNYENISCPSVNHKLTTPRILVMDYMEGVPIDDIEELSTEKVDMDALGEMLCSCYIKQIIEDGFFHADPHPGNIWVNDGKIIWLDMGMMGRLSAHDRKTIKRAIFALVNHDVLDMKNAILALGETRGAIDHTQLYDDVNVLMAQYGDLDLASLQLGVLIKRILNVLKENNIGVPNGFCMLARSVIIMEGVLKKCCPNVSFAEIFARTLEISFKKDFSLFGDMASLKREGYVLLKKSMHLPEQVSDILKMTLSGQTKVKLDLTGSEEPLKHIDKMINKIILAVVTSALLLGSSTICTTEMKPKIMDIPLLGVLGYLIAIFLGGKLIWNIYKSEWKTYRRK